VGERSPEDRGSAVASTADRPGPAFVVGGRVGGRYEVRGLLGRGGMGEVWRAFDLKLRVEVALKALREDLYGDERRRELLRQEVRAAREVVSPNVCRVFDLVGADGRELVSMEYVDGQTPLAVLQERGPLPLEEAQDIAAQFLAGLEAIHHAGLVHRDVKPENIMLTRSGRVVLMNFGLARQEAGGSGTVSGTPAYMAPEQARGEAVDARADVYAAGVVLAEMVCPDGSWLATPSFPTTLWNLTGPRSTVLDRRDEKAGQVVFTPDGDLLFQSQGASERWSVSPIGAAAPRALWSPRFVQDCWMDVDQAGRFAAVLAICQGAAAVVPLGGSPGSTFTLQSPPGALLWVCPASLDPGGRRLAVQAGCPGLAETNSIRILDLSTGDERTLDTHPKGDEPCEEIGSEMDGRRARGPEVVEWDLGRQVG